LISKCRLVRARIHAGSHWDLSQPTGRTTKLTDVAGGLSQGLASESNSPKLGSAATFHNRTSDEWEDDTQDRDNGGVGSEESWDEQQDKGNDMLPDAALMPDGTPDPSVVSGNADEMLPRDVQKRTAYYDYAAEKQLSQADAKLFYQRSQLEAQKTGGSNWGNSQNSPHGSPVMMPRSFSNIFEAEQSGMRRSGSVNSMKSGRNMVQGLVVICAKRCLRMRAD
jgi:AMP deaminase